VYESRSRRDVVDPPEVQESCIFEVRDAYSLTALGENC
jgi:hypothetical protein